MSFTIVFLFIFLTKQRRFLHNPNPNSLAINSLFSQTFLLNSLSLFRLSALLGAGSPWVIVWHVSLSLPHQSPAHRLAAASHSADNSMSPLSISHLAILKILSHFESNHPSPSVNGPPTSSRSSGDGYSGSATSLLEWRAGITIYREEKEEKAAFREEVNGNALASVWSGYKSGTD